MAFLSGIFNKQPTVAPQPEAAPAPAPAPAAPIANSSAADQRQAPANPNADPATMLKPLDSFVEMFKPKVQDPNAPRQATLADPILGPLDPNTFQQQVAQANFASTVPQDIMQKAVNGDVDAFQQALNFAAREAFAAAAQLSHGLVEHGSRTAADRVSASMDSRIKNFQIRSQNTGNQALEHPAVAPMLNAVKMQLATSNPNLTPSQIQEQAEMYFTQMADVLTAPKRQAAEASAKPKQGDFSHLLS